MSGIFFFTVVVTAVVVLIGLTLWLVASIVITHRDSNDAAEIIASMGSHFPLRRWWRR